MSSSAKRPNIRRRDDESNRSSLPTTARGRLTTIDDVLDKGNRYELQVELPGMDKDKVNIKARKDSIDISAEQTLSEEDKKKNYVYRSRSYSSYSATIPLPEEIVAENVKAKMNHGLLELEMPKKTPTKPEEQEGTRVRIT